MTTIRSFAACLSLLNGVLHFLPIIKAPSDPSTVILVIFGIVYLVIGVLLFLKIHCADLLGIVFPIVGLVIGFFMVGIKNWDVMLTFLFTLNAVMIISCVLLMLNKKNC